MEKSSASDEDLPKVAGWWFHFMDYLTIWFYFPGNGMVIFIDSMNVAEFYLNFTIDVVCSFPAKDRMLQMFHAANGRNLND